MKNGTSLTLTIDGEPVASVTSCTLEAEDPVIRGPIYVGGHCRVEGTLETKSDWLMWVVAFYGGLYVNKFRN